MSRIMISFKGPTYGHVASFVLPEIAETANVEYVTAMLASAEPVEKDGTGADEVMVTAPMPTPFEGLEVHVFPAGAVLSPREFADRNFVLAPTAAPRHS